MPKPKKKKKPNTVLAAFREFHDAWPESKRGFGFCIENGKSYSISDVLEEMEKKTTLGKKMEKDLIKLTVGSILDAKTRIGP